MMFKDNLRPFDFGNEDFRLVLRPVSNDDLTRYLQRLVDTDWESADSLVQLRDDLPFERVGSTRFYDQTRLFLRLVVESDGAPLTTLGGWLKRAYVARMMEQMQWPREYIESMRDMFKKVDEYDAKPLDIIRTVCESGNFVRRRRDRLYVPRTIHALLKDAQAGRLYRRLFQTFFRSFSLNYLYGGRETPLLQQSIAVILWRLHIKAGNWISLRLLPDEVLVDQVKRELAASDSFPNMELHTLYHRVVEPLMWFGLLEADREPERRHSLNVETRFRKTPLLDEFIHFGPFPLRPPAETN